MTTDILQAGFMVAAIVAAVLLYSFAALNLSRIPREGEARGEGGGFFEYPDHALLILLFGLIGVALLAFLGWRIPVAIERLHGSGGAFNWLAPDVEMSLLGRAAQVTGAASFFLIGLRWMRPAVLLGLMASVLVLGLLAFGYVFSGR